MNADTELFLKINQAFRGEIATRIFEVITQLGDGLVLAVIVIPLMFVFRSARLKKNFIGLVISVALSGLLVNVLKIAVDRPRPTEYFADKNLEIHTPLGTPNDRSFPSGHSQTAFGVAVYLSLLYPALSLFFLLAACLVGLSRIALGAHFPFDVLAGATIGAVFSAAGFIINGIYLKKKVKR